MLLPIRPASAQALREVRQDTSLRRARTCYGHLAGVAGVELMDEMLGCGWLQALPHSPGTGRIYYATTAEGAAALAKRGVTVPLAKNGKSLAFSCIDWTERRPHLGGGLGRAIVSALVESGWIERTSGSRVVVACRDLREWLDVGFQPQPVSFFLPAAFGRVKPQRL